jgi:transposase
MTQRKISTPAFKLEIAELKVDENYTTKQACEAPGAGETAVKRWRRQYLAERAGAPSPNARAPTPEQREMQQLKRRIRRLETEKDILIPTRGTRKSQRLLCPLCPVGAEGIFAKEMRWATVSLTN